MTSSLQWCPKGSTRQLQPSPTWQSLENSAICSQELAVPEVSVFWLLATMCGWAQVLPFHLCSSSRFDRSLRAKTGFIKCDLMRHFLIWDLLLNTEASYKHNPLQGTKTQQCFRNLGNLENASVATCKHWLWFVDIIRAICKSAKWNISLHVSIISPQSLLGAASKYLYSLYDSICIWVCLATSCEVI